MATISPVESIRQAAECIRTANHDTLRQPVRDMTYASDIYDAIGAIDTLVARLPQLCRQLSALLEPAIRQGTLTGPPEAPGEMLARMTAVASSLETAGVHLGAAFSTAGKIGGTL